MSLLTPSINPTHFFAHHKWQKTHVGSSSRELNLIFKRWERDKDKSNHPFSKDKKTISFFNKSLFQVSNNFQPPNFNLLGIF
jgi:hypothetical protein